MEKLSLEKFNDNKLKNLNAIKGGCKKTRYTDSGGCSGNDTQKCDGTYIEH